MRVAITVFTNQYAPKEFVEDTNHILWHFFLKHFDLWHHSIHRLYVLDHNCNLTVPEWARHLEGKIRIIDNPFGHHYTVLDNFVKTIPETDQVLILDSDMIIYNKDIVGEHFDSLITHDAAGIFSTDGCRMRVKNSVFDKNKVRNWRGKLANWLTYVRGNWLKNTSFEYLPWGPYNIEPFTERIVMEGGSIKELPEDYWQLVCDADGKIREQYYEAEDGYFIELSKDVRNVGYYHIWHATHMWKFLNNSIEGATFSYSEQMRLGAWAYTMTELVAPDKLSMFDEGIKAYGHFPKYIKQFKEYHKNIYDKLVQVKP